MFFTVRFGTFAIEHGVLFFNWISASKFYESINVDGKIITLKRIVAENGIVYTGCSYRKK